MAQYDKPESTEKNPAWVSILVLVISFIAVMLSLCVGVPHA